MTEIYMKVGDSDVTPGIREVLNDWGYTNMYRMTVSEDYNGLRSTTATAEVYITINDNDERVIIDLGGRLGNLETVKLVRLSFENGAEMIFKPEPDTKHI